jgi:hypothetical protein
MKIFISLSAIDPEYRVLNNIAGYINQLEPKWVPVNNVNNSGKKTVMGYNCHAFTAAVLKRQRDSDIILIFGTKTVPTHSVLVDSEYRVIADKYPGNEGHFDRETMHYVFVDASREPHPIVYTCTVHEFLKKFFMEQA